MHIERTASRILLLSSGIFHPPFLGRRQLKRRLLARFGARIRSTTRLAALRNLEPGPFCAVVLYIHLRQIQAETLHALENFSRAGGGILAIHSASASFTDRPTYFDLLGGRFDHHGPVQEFEVAPTPDCGEFLKGIRQFTVRDELYRHDWDPANKVHFSTLVKGELEPVVWTRLHGKGRVCYLSLGHCTETMQHPSVLQIIERGLEWVCAS